MWVRPSGVLTPPLPLRATSGVVRGPRPQTARRGPSTPCRASGGGGSGIRVCPLSDPEPLLMLLDKLPTQDFAVLGDDLHQTILVLGVIPNQFHQLLYLTLEAVQSPHHLFQLRGHGPVFRRSGGLGRVHSLAHRPLLAPDKDRRIPGSIVIV